MYMSPIKNHKKHLAVFTRYPFPGDTKTRLAPALGFQGAADLQQKMTEHIIFFLKQLKEDFDLDVEVRYEGGNADLMKRWLGDGFTYRQQGTGDLGFRMKGFFQDAFANGSDMAVIVGSDIPGITDALIKNAFDLLCACDMVLGPAKDGGYYLIGLKKRSLAKTFHHFFDNITWGTDTVLHQTVNIAKNLGVRLCLTQVMEDIDRPQDLFVWEKYQCMDL
jgi:rSAM/selenodomain-associated transferase 1